MQALAKFLHCGSRLMLLSYFALLAPALAAASAADNAATDQVRARLVASVVAVRPGEQILLGVQQRIIPHWHTYWINPGDSGAATTIQWDLPQGALAGPIEWPTPQRFMLGPIANYGYADEVTLLSAITVPQAAQIGSDFPIQATVKWLVCETQCIPQQVVLGMTLPVIAPDAVRRDSPARELITAAQSRLPVASPWPVQVEAGSRHMKLRLRAAEFQNARITELWFYPSEWGVMVHGAAQPWRVEGQNLTIELQPGDAPLAAGRALEGVLAITERVGSGLVTRGFAIKAEPAGVAASPTGATGSSVNALAALLFAFLGGLTLNLMPCVFPVLSMKALSMLATAQQAPRQTRLHGMAYTLGVLASFVALATLLLVLRAGGAQIGWGFQFQSPLFVLVMTYLMFAVGLSLSGVFYVGGSITGVGSALTARAGYAGSFFTGVLATLVATPCTAPFMGAALGYALSQPAMIVLAIFLSLGLGLAAPYLSLSLWPGLQRWLPRPGVWMERVKQALAFPMYATAVWLVWVLSLQAGTTAAVTALAGMVALAFAAWLYQTTRSLGGRGRSSGTIAATAVIAAALAAGCVGVRSAPTATTAMAANAAESWQPYSATRLESLRAAGAPVFLNFTAAWCITCIANERVALSSAAVKTAFARQAIAYLKGDWTNQDAHITQALSQFGRSGVPLYVYYPPGGNSAPVVLPQILTPQTVLTSIGAP